MLRIAHISATFPPYRGGTGNVCYHNARELVRRGHEVHVFTTAMAAAPANEMLGGVAVHRLPPLLRFGNASFVPGLRRVAQGFDLLHLHYPFFGGELAALASWRERTPLVITYHQDVLLDGWMGLVERAARHSVGRMTLHAAARVLFTSLDYASASHVRPLLRGRKDRIGELPNGVDVAHFQAVEPSVDIRARHQLVPEDRVALLVAGLDRAHYFKGVHVLLQALAQSMQNIKALIVGDGDLRASYMAAARELGIAERVSFAGRVSDVELPAYYRVADVTVLPSTTMGEAFGLVLLESMACGTPVIASNLPGVRTVVSHGVDGFLVDPGSSSSLAGALDLMMRDDPARQAMGAAGRAKVERRYSWPRIGDSLEAIYAEELCRGVGRSPLRGATR